MNSNIDLKITGVRGGSPNYNQNKSCVTVFVDKSYNKITVDAFQDQEEKYKRRGSSQIEITNGDGETLVFKSFDEFFAIVQKGLQTH